MYDDLVMSCAPMVWSSESCEQCEWRQCCSKSFILVELFIGSVEGGLVKCCYVSCGFKCDYTLMLVIYPIYQALESLFKLWRNNKSIPIIPVVRLEICSHSSDIRHHERCEIFCANMGYKVICGNHIGGSFRQNGQV